MWVKNVGNTGIFVFSSLGVLLHLGRGLCEDSGSVEGLGNDRFATDKYAGKTIFFFYMFATDKTSTQETRIFFSPVWRYCFAWEGGQRNVWGTRDLWKG